MARFPILFALTTALALPAPASAAGDFGANLFNILPPGQSGTLPPNANSTDQLKLYDALAPLFGNVTAADIPKYFKDAHFDAGTIVKVERPRKGLTIKRDTFGVPHIHGKTRALVMFGSGYATAQDRALFLEVVRGPARIAAVDPPGLDALTVAGQLRQFTPTRKTEAFIAGQAKLFARSDRAGRSISGDVDNYVAGINAWYRKSHNRAKPWTRVDVIAVTALLGQTFGRGGGNEVAASRLLGALQGKLGPGAGFDVWRDLRRLDDPEAPTNTPKPFPYMTDPGKLGAGSLVVDPPAGAAAAQAGVVPAPRHLMSNALLIDRTRSATGRPLGVMGAQLGYYYPMLFLELDLHGGGFDARGGVLPGEPYVLLGHAKDYAWDATSGDSDLMDQFLEQLCNRDGSPPTAASTSYVYRGKCRPMTTFDAGQLGAGGGQPAERVKFMQTVHGPVAGVVTAGGKPYAVANSRSTRGREFVSSRAILDFNRNSVHSAREFLRSASKLEYTFNLFYIDNRDIAWYHACRCPIRAPGTYPGIPTLGTGRYDWRGFIGVKAHPQAINPPGGAILDWNSKPAPGWGAADDNWDYGSIQRRQLFTGLGPKVTLADVVSSMNRAATQDIKPVRVWPTIAAVLASGRAPDPMTQQAADLVTAWSAAGGSRLDRDLDGKVDDPGAAILDAAWPRIADAVMTPVIGQDGATLLEGINHRDDVANSGGSSYFAGWYEYVDKDLRALLGRPVTGPFSRRYCGGGDLAACRDAIWNAMKQAAGELAATQGADPASWRADATKERIVFTPPGLLPDTMRWVNRTSFQQVVEFSGHRR